MKIGIFGDSWIDICQHGTRIEDERYAYPALIKKHFNASVDFHGYFGTSNWYSFDKFVKTHKKYDVVLFVHGGHIRWPSLPIDETGNHYNVSAGSNIFELINPDKDKSSEFLNNINKYFFDILPEDLLVFLSKSIYDQVNQICKENNIYLVNLIPFTKPYQVMNTDFPVITNLIEVSNKEKTTLQGKKMLTSKWIREYQSPDPRVCHLNFKNNRILANIISKLIEQKAYKKHIDARTYLTEYEDIETDKWIEEWYEKNIDNG